jgi:hypothetical protein
LVVGKAHALAVVLAVVQPVVSEQLSRSFDRLWTLLLWTLVLSSVVGFLGGLCWGYRRWLRRLLDARRSFDVLAAEEFDPALEQVHWFGLELRGVRRRGPLGWLARRASVPVFSLRATAEGTIYSVEVPGHAVGVLTAAMYPLCELRQSGGGGGGVSGSVPGGDDDEPVEAARVSAAEAIVTPLVEPTIPEERWT